LVACGNSRAAQAAQAAQRRRRNYSGYIHSKAQDSIQGRLLIPGLTAMSPFADLLTSKNEK